jgi:hypothetical protein
MVVKMVVPTFGNLLLIMGGFLLHDDPAMARG